MRQFLQHLRAAWLFGRLFPYIPEADGGDYWTEKDGKSLQAFMSTHAGKKLQVRLRNYSVKAAMSAVRKAENTSYESGVAAGISMGIAAIDAHHAQVPYETPEQAEQELEELIYE